MKSHLVVGATGFLGGLITRRLLEKDTDVRILVRPNSNFMPLIEIGAQPVIGDLKDPRSLDQACEGIDVVITTANSAQRGGRDNPETVDCRGNRDLIDAAKAAGVVQFVFVSAVSSDRNSPFPFLRARAETEAYLRKTGMIYTILAPDILFEIWGGMIIGEHLANGLPVTLVGQGNVRHSFVSAPDVAAFAAAVVGNIAAIDRRIELGGPEALTWTELIDIAAHVLGHEIPIRYVPGGDAVRGLPLEAGMLMASMEMAPTSIDMAQTASTFGVQLTPMVDAAQRMFGVPVA